MENENLSIEMEERAQKRLWYLVLAAAIGIGTLILLAPHTGLSSTGQRLLSTLLFIIVVWATEAVSYPVSTLILIILMTWSLVAGNIPFKDAFAQSLAGFAGTVPISVIAGTGFAAVVKEIGLSERIVYQMMRLVAGAKPMADSSRVLGALILADIPLAFVFPPTTGRSALYISIAEGLRKPFKFAELDNASEPNPFQKAVWISAAVAPVIMGAAFLTGGSATIMVGRMIEAGTGISQNWTQTFVLLFAPAVLMLCATWAILVKLFPSNVAEVSIDFIHTKLADLGPMKYSEKYVLSSMLIAGTLWVTDNWHPIPAEIVLVLLATAMFFPRIAPGDWKRDSRHIAWGAFMVIAVSSGFANLLSKHGVVKMLAGLLAATEISGFVGIMLLMVAATFIIRFGVVSITATAAILVPISIVLGETSGLSPNMQVGLAWVTYVFCRVGFILPYQTANLITVYEYNYFSRQDLLKAGSLMTIATLIIYISWASFVMPILM